MGICCMSQETETGSVSAWRDGMRKEMDGREAQQAGDTYIPMADSCWGLTENSKNKKNNGKISNNK